MKKGLLTVSFGTSHDDTKAKTIDHLEQELKNTFPQRKFYRAWTSTIIKRILLKRDNIKIFGVGEALMVMANQGIEDILVQPTHVLGGTENDLMLKEIRNHAHRFTRIAIGQPLLDTTEDYFKVLEAVSTAHPLEKGEALILMGHGSSHSANSAYAALDYMAKATGKESCFIGTVEGYPDFDTMLTMLKASPLNKVCLAPLMIVAGEHAKNDMAGEDETSWCSQFKAAGYPVRCSLQGLGELEPIAKLFCSHAQHAKVYKENKV